jgi:hypothetical protein
VADARDDCFDVMHVDRVSSRSASGFKRRRAPASSTTSIALSPADVDR